MGTIDDLFKGMADADANGRGGNTKPGLYEVEIGDILTKKGQNPKKPGDSFIAKFAFATSNNEDHKPGTTSSWVLKFTWPATFGHLTKFVYALLSVIDSDGDLIKMIESSGDWESTEANLKDKKKRQTAELYARAICGSDTAKKELGELWTEGMFKGARLGLETKMGKTSTGGDFTEHYWSAPKKMAQKVAA